MSLFNACSSAEPLGGATLLWLGESDRLLHIETVLFPQIFLSMSGCIYVYKSRAGYITLFHLLPEEVNMLKYVISKIFRIGEFRDRMETGNFQGSHQGRKDALA